MPIAKPPKRRCRGFTLIEMVLTLLLSSLLMVTAGTFFSWALRQTHAATLSGKLDARARALTTVLRKEARLAGLGYALDTHVPGLRATGNCLTPGADQSDSPLITQCTGLDEDGDSDRLRFAYVDLARPYVVASSNPANGPCVGGTGTSDFTKLYLSPNDLILTPGYTAPDTVCYVISGACVAGSTYPRGSMEVCQEPHTTSSQNQDGCGFQIPVYYGEDPKNSPNGCSLGWDTGFSLAAYASSDYRVARGPGGFRAPTLSRRDAATNRYASAPLSHFQVVYGIDLSDPPDGLLDICPGCNDDPNPSLFNTKLSWCRDLSTLCGMSLTSGQPLDASTIYNRIIAVHVSFQLYEPNATSQRANYSQTFALKNRVTR